MGIREHQQPEVVTIGQLRARAAAQVPGISNLPPPPPSSASEQVTCPTCKGSGKVAAATESPEKTIPPSLSGGAADPGK